MEIMEHLQLPAYIRHTIRSYLTYRVLLYDTDDGIKKYEVTAGVPQRSVHGRLLWILLYDGVLRLPVPRGGKIIGYADDIAINIVAKELVAIQETTTEVVSSVKNSLEGKKLELSGQKTEAILITSRTKLENVELTIDGHNMATSPAIKYIGVMLDARLTYANHLKRAGEKATKIYFALSRLMSNNGRTC